MAPITLNKSQFLATAAAKKPGASYTNYLRYVANARANKLAAPSASSDPYSSIIASAPQPYTPAQIQQMVGNATSGYAPALSGAEIQSQAQGEISPLVQAVTQAITGQTKAASDAISGYTHSLQSGLAGTNFAAPYQQAEQGQADVDAALQQSLNGAGQADVADLGKRLGVINDPAVAAAQAAVGQNATANAGTQVAQGSNALADLIANAAAASSYGQKLGGVAGLYGVQQLAQNAANGQAQIGSQTQQLESQVPSIISDLTSQSNSNRNTKASAANNLLSTLLGVNDDRSKDVTTLKANQLSRQDALASAEAKNAATVQAAQINAQAKATAAEIAQAKSDRSYRLQLAKTLGYDPVTNKPLPGFEWKGGDVGGTIIKSPTIGKTPKLSAKQVQDYRGQAATLAERTFKGYTPPATAQNPNPKPLPPVSYQEAINEARQAGIPLAIFIPYLNMHFQPGQRGRPPIVKQVKDKTGLGLTVSSPNGGYIVTGLGG